MNLFGFANKKLFLSCVCPRPYGRHEAGATVDNYNDKLFMVSKGMLPAEKAANAE